MKENLKQFVQKYVEKQTKNSFPHLYIVGILFVYKKISKPVHIVQYNKQSKLHNLIPQQKYHKVFINKILQQSIKPLQLEPKSNDQSKQKIGVVLLVNSGNGITIQLPQIDNQCIISGIKISHSGNSQNQIKKQLMQHQHILNIFQREQRQIQQLQHQYVNRVTFNKIQNTILMLNKGKLTMENCILSLNYLVKSCNMTIPAVCIQKQGTLAMYFCQIKGHSQKQTIGIVSKLGTLYLQNSTIIHHKQGAILIWGLDTNNSRIMKNHIQQNSIGIHVVGEQFKLKIYNNNIVRNKIGIKIGLGCQTDINRNNITENINGIQIYSAFPIIYLNIIQKQQENGIICKSYKKFICCAQIKKNIAIVGNGLNGILIQGENNKSKIIQNHLIAFNKQSGIKVMKQAFPLILLNKIYKNHQEGILIVQKSNAIVQRNQITHNLECNLAMGGENSHHTAIFQNLISHSPGPGIVLVHSGRCKISRNDIAHNSQGIVMIQSKAQIRRNFISKNQNNGIVSEDSSQPKLIENFITRNQSIGLFLRDQSGGNVSKGKNQSILHSNIIVGNQIQVGLEEPNLDLAQELKFSNTIEGNVQQPDTNGCQII